MSQPLPRKHVPTLDKRRLEEMRALGVRVSEAQSDPPSTIGHIKNRRHTLMDVRQSIKIGLPDRA